MQKFSSFWGSDLFTRMLCSHSVRRRFGHLLWDSVAIAQNRQRARCTEHASNKIRPSKRLELYIFQSNAGVIFCVTLRAFGSNYFSKRNRRLKSIHQYSAKRSPTQTWKALWCVYVFSPLFPWKSAFWYTRNLFSACWGTGVFRAENTFSAYFLPSERKCVHKNRVTDHASVEMLLMGGCSWGSGLRALFAWQPDVLCHLRSATILSSKCCATLFLLKRDMGCRISLAVPCLSFSCRRKSGRHRPPHPPAPFPRPKRIPILRCKLIELFVN